MFAYLIKWILNCSLIKMLIYLACQFLMEKILKFAWLMQVKVYATESNNIHVYALSYSSC